MMSRFGLFALGEQVKSYRLSYLLTECISYAYIVGMADLLGTFEQAVLLSILRLGEDAYGRAILRHVQISLGRNVAAGAIYTTLDRLEQRGFVNSKLAPGTAIRGGRARRYYMIAAEGKRVLADAQKAMAKMWQGVKLPVTVKS
jgi:PadR family transcriptional regulator, regulatory protein PadR